jgi:quercetin dioxygenase-like cupin family protein
MNKKIIYRNDEQSLNKIKIDPKSGSAFWSVEGSNVQFTWFDVPANTNFPTHKHDSEQITYVLDGELFFRSENTIYKLLTGDCILIPGNTHHEVWTESIPAKAVDAWSPINKTFSNNSILLNK